MEALAIMTALTCCDSFDQHVFAMCAVQDISLNARPAGCALYRCPACWSSLNVQDVAVQIWQGLTLACTWFPHTLVTLHMTCRVCNGITQTRVSHEHVNLVAKQMLATTAALCHHGTPAVASMVIGPVRFT